MTGDDKPSALDTSVRLGSRGDDVYAALIDAHRGLSHDESARLNARLVLMLANHIGDAAAVLDAIARARAGVTHDSVPNIEEPSRRSSPGSIYPQNSAVGSIPGMKPGMTSRPCVDLG
jgi:hypothetical protein